MVEEKPLSDEEKYLRSLDARKMSRTVVEADIPGTENLMKFPPDKMAEVLARIISMGSIVSLHLEVGHPLRVKFYEQVTTFGKGKLNNNLTLLSPEAIEEAKRKKSGQQP